MNFLSMIAGILSLIIVITIDGFTDPTIPLMILMVCMGFLIYWEYKKGWIQL